MNNKKGFTLIELMVVIAIVGILASIAIPSLIEFSKKSKVAEMIKKGAKLSQRQLDIYSTNYNDIHSMLDEAASALAKKKYDGLIAKKVVKAEPILKKVLSNSANAKESKNEKMLLTFAKSQLEMLVEILERQRRLFETHHPEEVEIILNIKDEIEKAKSMIRDIEKLLQKEA